MKRIIALLLCFAAAVSLASCGAEKEPDVQTLSDESYSRALDLYSRGAYVSAGIVIDKAVEEYGSEERFEELKKQIKEAADAALTTEVETTEDYYARWLTETQPEPVTEPSTTAPTTTKPETTTKAATTATTSSTTAKKETTTKGASTTKGETKTTSKQSTTTAKPTTTTTTRRHAKPLTTAPKGTTTTVPETTTSAETSADGGETTEDTTNLELA